ncbi:MAG: alanine-zipper protein [Candidatus Competibacterales bacterium]
MSSNVYLRSALLAMPVLFAGCATSNPQLSEEIAALRAEVAAARSAAEAAEAQAAATQQTAERALAASREAQDLAQSAMVTATATDEKLNRMFRQSMLK